MAPDLSGLDSTPRRPRAATSVLPAMVTPSYAAPTQHSGSPPLGSSEYGITSTAQGPLRHPKPLTPSDLHMALEKEQEAMVNRLTRELSLLRQQTASTASTASSTSNFNDSTDGLYTSPNLGSSTRSQSSRRHRSSSSLSAHTPSAPVPQTASVTGIAPSREAPTRPVRSREASLTSRRPSVGSLSSYSQYPHGETYGSSPTIYPHRNSVSQTHLGHSGTPMSRSEEVAFHKSEFDIVRRENDMLRRRVRELESTLKTLKEGHSEGPTGTDLEI
ncbi:hypothetical protein N7481_011495 [Penicillium waksmanii]|uniref:uncharacterized protein n=1 Tax=Penicillium waksmanii TaxID=69791 RepID=UPI00254914A3|nr:uncharacterized protein N7481_011495 [Penicillium waksmanii]KAJ5974285.1 hypothetical protein N7481_011495 [Penicillium waksmanii]